MKTNLPKYERLAEEEKKVIEWAFNFVHSIYAGGYTRDDRDLDYPKFWASGESVSFDKLTVSANLIPLALG